MPVLGSVDDGRLLLPDVIELLGAVELALSM